MNTRNNNNKEIKQIPGLISNDMIYGEVLKLTSNFPKSSQISNDRMSTTRLHIQPESFSDNSVDEIGLKLLKNIEEVVKNETDSRVKKEKKPAEWKDPMLEMAKEYVQKVNEENKIKYKKVNEESQKTFEDDERTFQKAARMAEQQFTYTKIPINFDTWTPELKKYIAMEFPLFLEENYTGNLGGYEVLFKKHLLHRQQNINCDCIGETMTRNTYNSIHPIQIALANNKYHFLQKLSLQAKINPIIEEFVRKWMENSQKSIIDAAFMYTGEEPNNYFALQMFLDPNKIYCKYTSFEVDDNGHITTIPFYCTKHSYDLHIQAKYENNFISLCISSGFWTIAYELLQQNQLPIRLIPAILSSAALTDNLENVHKLLTILMEPITAVIERTRMNSTNVNRIFFQGSTFLHDCIDRGNIGMTQLMLSWLVLIYTKARIYLNLTNVTDPWGNNAVRHAFITNETEIAWYLFEMQVEGKKLFDEDLAVIKQYYVKMGLLHGTDEFQLSKFVIDAAYHGDRPIQRLIMAGREDFALDFLQNCVRKNTKPTMQDLNQALLHSLWPRYHNIYVKIPGTDEFVKNHQRMKNIVGMLLLAGAQISKVDLNLYQVQRNSWVPKDILELLEISTVRPLKEKTIVEKVADGWETAYRQFME